MTMKMPNIDKKNFFSSIPTLFWAILLIAVLTGLIFGVSAEMLSQRNADTQVSEADQYKYFTEGMENATPQTQRDLRRNLAGSWVVEKDNVQMIIDYGPNGEFIYRASDKDLSFYILIAHGRYTALPQNEDIYVLMSERRNEPNPLQKPAPYYKFRNLDILETAFSYVRQGDRLLLKLADTPKPQENFSALFKEFSDENGYVSFEKIGRR